MKIFKQKAKGAIALLMTLAMLIGMCLPAGAFEFSNEDAVNTDQLAYSIGYENGKIVLKVNPETVYRIIKDKDISKEELKALIPAEILDAVSKGRELTLDDLKELAANYVTVDELKAIINDVPEDILREYLSIADLREIFSVQEILDIIKIDDIINSIDQDEISALLTDEVAELVLKQEIIDKVVTEDFLDELLQGTTLIDDITTDPAIVAKLKALVTDELVEKITADDEIMDRVEALILPTFKFEDLALTNDQIDKIVNLVLAESENDINAFLNKDTDGDGVGEVTELLAGVITADDLTSADVDNILTDELVKTLVNGGKLDSVINSLLQDNAFIEKAANTLSATTTFAPETLYDKEVIVYDDVDDYINQEALKKYVEANVDKQKIYDAGLIDYSAVTEDDVKDAFNLNTPADITAIFGTSDIGDSKAAVQTLFNYYSRNNNKDGFYNAIRSLNNLKVNAPKSVTDITNLGLTVQGLLSATVDIGGVPTKVVAEITVNGLLNNHANKVAIKARLVDYAKDNIDAVIDNDTNGEIKADIKNKVLADRDLFATVLGAIDKADAVKKLTTTTRNNLIKKSGIFNNSECKQIFVEIFNPTDTTKGYINAIGGYSVIIDKVDMKVLIKDVITPAKLLVYFDFNDIISAVGIDKITTYININEVMSDLGGPTELVKMYSNDELTAIINAIGKDKLVEFVKTNILDKVDIRALANDIIDYAKTKVPALKAMIRDLAEYSILVLNTRIEGMYYNDVEFFDGRFDINALLYALIDSIPDVEDFINVPKDGTLLSAVIKLDINGYPEGIKTFEYGFEVKFVDGDPANLQNFVEKYADNFKLDVDEALNVTLDIGLPSAVAGIYETLLTDSRIPEKLQKALILAPDATVGEMIDLVEELMADERVFTVINEKLDAIKAKAYAKIDSTIGRVDRLDDQRVDDAVAKAKAKVDELLDRFVTKENYDKAVAKTNTVLDKIASSFGEATPVQSLYEGEGTFGVNKGASFDFLAAIQRFVSVPEEVKIMFKSTVISGNLDASVRFDGIFQLTVVNKDGEEFVTYLPEGISLDVVDNAKAFGELWNDDLEVVDTMPAEDTVLHTSDSYYVQFKLPDGTVASTQFYLLSDTSAVVEPDLSTLTWEGRDDEGYTYAWDEYELGLTQATIVEVVETEKPAEPQPEEYTIKWIAKGETVLEKTWTFGDAETYKDITSHPDITDKLAANEELVGWFIDENEIKAEDLQALFETEGDIVITAQIKTKTPEPEPKDLTINFEFVYTDKGAAYTGEKPVATDSYVFTKGYGSEQSVIEEWLNAKYKWTDKSNVMYTWRLAKVEGYTANGETTQNVKVTYEKVYSYIYIVFQKATAQRLLNAASTPNVEEIVVVFGTSDADLIKAINEKAPAGYELSETAEQLVAANYDETVEYKKDAGKDNPLTLTLSGKTYNISWYADSAKTELIKTETWTFGGTYPTSHPSAPEKEGYTFTGWDKELNAALFTEPKDIDIIAQYTKNEPVTPPAPGGDDGTDTTPTPGVPGATDTQAPVAEEEGGFPWWIIIIIVAVLIIAAIIILFITKKDKDDDDNEPEPEAVVIADEPEVEAEPDTEAESEDEDEPVEEEHIVLEHVTAEEADVLMTDESAKKLVETVVVKKEAQGKKATINLSKINAMFEAGETVNLAALKAKKLVPASTTRYKVLAEGNLDKALTVEADSFSVQAVKMITLTGGTAIQVVSE